MIQTIPISKFTTFIFDVLFPKECVGCKREGAWLCANCANLVYINEHFFCASCNKQSLLGNTCQSCRKKDFPPHSLLNVTSYNDTIARDLIHIFKYRFCEDASHDLAILIRKFLLKYIAVFPKIDLIIPVPLHKTKFDERGFNQAALIARLAAREIGQEFAIRENLLIRSKNNLPQVEVENHERQRNVKNIFNVISPEEIVGKSVLLVDDVYTTGATILECARTLRACGARFIHVFVFAKSRHSKSVNL